MLIFAATYVAILLSAAEFKFIYFIISFLYRIIEQWEPAQVLLFQVEVQKDTMCYG